MTTNIHAALVAFSVLGRPFVSTQKLVVGAAIGLTLAFLSIPTAASAFDVVESYHYQLSDTASLHLLTFEYGFLNADFWMPIAASRGTAETTGDLTYNLYGSDGERESAGTTYAIVLSEAEIDDAQYYVPRRTRETFTLAVLVTDAPTGATNMKVDALSFTILREGERSEFAVGTDVLEAYRTPSLPGITLTEAQPQIDLIELELVTGK